MVMGRRGVSQAWMCLLACSFAVSACTVLPKGQADLDVSMKERGIASWYGEDFHGWMTANGEIYDMEAFTAAHRTLPLGTAILVTNVENGKQVRVRINDRGPYLYGRVLDLSLAGARALDMVDSGVAAVQIEVVGDQSAGLISAADLLPIPSAAMTADAGDSILVLTQPRHVRAVRTLPNDLWRQRRVRRAADYQAAERRAYAAVASLEIP
ncbi:MAG: septal ring lytic transglycosylase RlpA family protein [Nitrospiraceae bacterium]|nr:septal ring lytic transglycosylase RlpA family protein [Nitrospiraceae bacterium]